MKTIIRLSLVLAVIGGGVWLVVVPFLTPPTATVSACGGLFCQNTPVDQQAERIIFTVNGNGTISAYVQINYTGSAPDFSWVVPVPNVPELDVAEVATFDELSTLTQPILIAPPMPDCAMIVMEAEGGADDSFDSAEENEVDILSQGSVGPYDYVVITSPDANEMFNWLIDNGYRLTPAMEPLIKVYNDEGMVFLAMKLRGESGVQDIQPIKMTYRSDEPMIPLRLTAVAANPDMSIVTWIFADTQAYTTNYASPTINDADIRLFPFFSDLPPNTNPPNNYLQLVDQTVDVYDGRALITEYASPTNPLSDGISDPLLKDLMSNYAYVTRFFGRISPEEMTVDPMFAFDESLPDVSNIHDLTKFDPEDVYGCTNRPIDIEFNERVVPDDWR